MEQLSASYPDVAAKALGRGSNDYVLVDVGSGTFKYGQRLLNWAKSQHERAQVFAVDVIGRELVKYRSPQVKFIYGRIESSWAREALEEEGVKKINLFTIFNPNPGIIPNPLALGEIAADAPLVLAIADPVRSDNFQLDRMVLPTLQFYGYSPLVVLENPFKLSLIEYFGNYRFSPLVVAVPMR